MAWVISVGKAGMKGRAHGQALTVCLDADCVQARVQVGAAGGAPAARETAQARQVWRSVLATLVGGERE